ncbi:MAG: hypothetical protein EOM64_07465 [Erysipelotrichia bacterium]|nr:hypothetical protein [Erysipelotrichia bacterium]
MQLISICLKIQTGKEIGGISEFEQSSRDLKQIEQYGRNRTASECDKYCSKEAMEEFSSDEENPLAIL